LERSGGPDHREKHSLGREFVEAIERASCRKFGVFLGSFDTLGLASRQSRRRLAEENKARSGQVRSRIYEAQSGAWVDGAPLSKIMMPVDEFGDDGKTPCRGIVTWYSADESRIVTQVDFPMAG
jgi:hypothetical protein